MIIDQSSMNFDSRILTKSSSTLVLVIVSGLRQFHESGPELKRTISGHLNEILDAEEPSTRRNISFFGGDADHPSTRRNIAFFGGHGPAIVQVLQQLLLLVKLIVMVNEMNNHNHNRQLCNYLLEDKDRFSSCEH